MSLSTVACSLTLASRVRMFTAALLAATGRFSQCLLWSSSESTDIIVKILA